jgi:hypothetical protein
MATPQMLKVSFPVPYELYDEFKKIDKRIAATCLGAGVKRAMETCLSELKALTPRGPTGNLYRAAHIRTKKYTNTGTGVAVVGYRKAGKAPSRSAGGGKVRKGSDRAFHQFWIEKGTKNRTIDKPADIPYVRSNRETNRKLKRALGAKQAKELREKNQFVKRQGGYIASSFNGLGPFKFTGSRKSRASGRVTTSPKFPKAFFRKSRTPIDLGPMYPQRPIETAWQATKSWVQADMAHEMRASLENAKKIIADRAARANSMATLGRYL